MPWQFLVVLLPLLLVSDGAVAAHKPALSRPVPALEGAQKRAAEKAIDVYTPNGWWLEINADGSGRVGYGSGFPDSWSFQTGTFAARKVTQTLRALANDREGKRSSHFAFHLESERQGPDKAGPARYSRDPKVIPALFAKALVAAQVKKRSRGNMLLKKYPPGLPKEK